MRTAIGVIALIVLAAAAPADDAFDRAVLAIDAGSRASDGGKPGRLRRAALDLRASAATPIAGEDIAARWLHETHAPLPPPDRDRALGPGYRALDLVGGGSAQFDQTFLAGQRARVAVVPARQSDFAMRVIDDVRATVCSASPGHARCDWVPSYTTRFRIEVSNPGRQAGRYFLILQ